MGHAYHRKNRPMTSTNTKQISPAEQLLAMEGIWESMRLEEDEPESPIWHMEILEARKAPMETGKVRFVTLEQLKVRLTI
jgi:hypothetical protein